MTESNGWQLFTRGPLFEAVQALQLFRDSKTFPDMIPNGFDLSDRAKVEQVLKEFIDVARNSFLIPVNRFQNALNKLDDSQEPLTVERLKQVRGLGQGVIDFRSYLSDLIYKYFRTRPETAVELRLPRDANCSMETYIDGVWNTLKRDSRNLPQEMFNGTLIKLDYPYVVAGGRFDEVYYWDGYFTGIGLVLSGGLDLFECMVKNYATFIQRHGFIPNGTRCYYLTRSQPPFFYCMVNMLCEMKGQDFAKKVTLDIDDVKTSYAKMVEKEYQFWMGYSKYGNDRTVSLGEGAVLNRYWDHYWDDELRPPVQPRPESYHEDIGHYADTQEGTDAATFFRHIRAAAESGWDFSSRWFRPDPVGWDGGIRRGIETIRTTNILPVDLNALLYGMEKKLFEWTGDPKYKKAADDRKHAILKYFWNEELGWFFDYSIEEGQTGQTDVWSLAGAFPLFAEMFEKEDQQIVERMKRTIRDRFVRPGGVVTSLFETGQQWDYPNGWAPLQWIVVRGLLNYDGRALALEIAKRFIQCVGKTYSKDGRIMEKYNVCDPEVLAGGGEYLVQPGFSWSKGVVKALISEFRPELEQDEKLRKYLA